MSNRRINTLILGAIVFGLLWAFLAPRQLPVGKSPPLPPVAPDMVPLVSGEEETIRNPLA